MATKKTTKKATKKTATKKALSATERAAKTQRDVATLKRIRHDDKREAASILLTTLNEAVEVARVAYIETRDASGEAGTAYGEAKKVLDAARGTLASAQVALAVATWAAWVAGMDDTFKTYSAFLLSLDDVIESHNARGEKKTKKQMIQAAKVRATDYQRAAQVQEVARRLDSNAAPTTVGACSAVVKGAAVQYRKANGIGSRTPLTPEQDAVVAGNGYDAFAVVQRREAGKASVTTKPMPSQKAMADAASVAMGNPSTSNAANDKAREDRTLANEARVARAEQDAATSQEKGEKADGDLAEATHDGYVPSDAMLESRYHAMTRYELQRNADIIAAEIETRDAEADARHDAAG